MTRPRATALLLFAAVWATAWPAEAIEPNAPADSVQASADRVDQLLEENRDLRARLERVDEPDTSAFWWALGFFGQFLFGMRFVVQWIATERQKKSVIPVAFWYLSLAGSVTLLTYAIYRLDWVFIAGFSLNMIIYLRNLYYIHLQQPAEREGLVEGEQAPDQEMPDEGRDRS